jgi:integrase
MANTFNFTKEALNAIAIPESGKRAVYHDAKTTGLQIRVTSTGVKSFSLYRRVKGGQPERVTLGRFPDMTIEQARRLAAKVNFEIEEGSNPANVKRAIKAEPTLAEFFDEEYKPRHGIKLKTWRNSLSQFNRYVSPAIGNEKLTAVNREQIARIVSDVEKTGKSGSMVNKVRNLISGIYRHAIEWGFAESNPATGVRGRKENKRDRFIQASELPRFFSSVAAESNPDIRDYILLSLLTGARKSNVVEIEWKNLNLEDGILRLPVTKNDDPQNVTLSPEAVEILKSRADNGSKWVFPGKGKTGHLVEPKAGWKRALDRDEVTQLQERIRASGHKFDWPAKIEKPKGFRGRVQENLEESLTRARMVAEKLKIDTAGARLADLRIHDLRRTLGSWQAKTGASLVIIGKSLNHKSQASTAIYARLDLDPVRQSVNTATAAILEAAGVTQTNVGTNTDGKSSHAK